MIKQVTVPRIDKICIAGIEYPPPRELSISHYQDVGEFESLSGMTTTRSLRTRTIILDIEWQNGRKKHIVCKEMSHLQLMTGEIILTIEPQCILLEETKLVIQTSISAREFLDLSF